MVARSAPSPPRTPGRSNGVRLPAGRFRSPSYRTVPAVPLFVKVPASTPSVPLTAPWFVKVPAETSASRPTLAPGPKTTSPPVAIAFRATVPFRSTRPPASTTLPPTVLFTRTVPPAAITSPATGALTWTSPPAASSDPTGASTRSVPLLAMTSSSVGSVITVVSSPAIIRSAEAPETRRRSEAEHREDAITRSCRCMHGVDIKIGCFAQARRSPRYRIRPWSPSAAGWIS